MRLATQTNKRLGKKHLPMFRYAHFHLRSQRIITSCLYSLLRAVKSWALNPGLRRSGIVL